MGDVKGFQKFKRLLPGYEAKETRIQHFNEFVQDTPESHQKDQSARCMDCGVPFCHFSCPLDNKIPDFNEAVFRGEWKLAYEILTSTNNFPEFTGRICPAPCEAGCVLGINEEPVSIEYIEKSIIERAYKEGWVKPQSPIIRNGKKVAVIGSGPAGLACADELNKAGFQVTVFERKDKVGGLLRYGIPDFKLEKDIVERRINIMKASGIQFVTQCDVGKDISILDLEAQFDVTVLAGGSTVARDLNIPGRKLKGVHLAMEFLEENNRKVAGLLSLRSIKVKDQDVVVIGGGDTGSDCIGTSNRLGAKSITQIELLYKPPSRRTDKDPWPLWPMTIRTSSSHEEGCEREWSILTKRFISEDGKNLSGLEVVEVLWERDEKGHYSMKEVDGSLRVIPCTKVFLAIGFLYPEKNGLIEELGVALDEKGNIKTKNYATSKKGIYAAGDMRRGQSLVVWAIAEGRSCAERIMKDYIPNFQTNKTTIKKEDLLKV